MENQDQNQGQDNNSTDDSGGAGPFGFRFNERDSVTKSQLLKLRSLNDYSTFELTASVPGSNAETSTLYPIFYVANVKCFLIEARMRHTAAGGASSTVTIEKLPSKTAKGSGGSMLATYFALDGTANQTQWKTATTVIAGTQLSPGDAVALRPVGTLTNARDVTITALFGINNKDIPQGPSVSAVISGA